MKQYFITVVLFILFFSPIPVFAKTTEWNLLDSGFQYTTITADQTIIHAFKVNPHNYQFRIIRANDEVFGTTAASIAKQHQALLVINGGFFNTDHKSIGLIVNQGKQLTPIHRTSWWSIFQVQKNIPTIIPPDEFKLNANIDMALQVGPRILIHGHIPTLKNRNKSRSVIGITKDGQILLILTRQKGISLTELAKRIKVPLSKGGLNCENAMALDGGHSSQLYAHINGFIFNEQNISNITNGIAIFKRPHLKK